MATANVEVHDAGALALSGSDGASRTSPWCQQPAVQLAVCFAAGVLLDRRLGLPWTASLTAAVAAWTVWWFLWRRSLYGGALVALWLAALACGAARHHSVWSWVRRDDVAWFAPEDSEPVTLQAVVLQRPVLRRRDRRSVSAPWPPPVRTETVVECRWLLVEGRRVPVSGRAWLRVAGRKNDLRIGDVVTVYGRFARPLPPRNPGEFDYAQYLARRGVRCVVWADRPEAVQHTGRRVWLPWREWRAKLRDVCDATLRSTLSPQTLPLARTLLLGDRSGVTDQVRQAFVESGTMHLLAISGLHVGILASLFWCLARLFNLPNARAACLVGLAVATYAFVTDVRPPVLRASLLLALATGAVVWGRPVLSVNLLGATACVLLWLSPTDVFDPGAQLSFLAVLALLWAASAGRARREARGARRVFELGWRGVVRQWAGWTTRWLSEAYRMSGAVWLATAPLVAYWFNVVSPVGLLLNVLLIPLVVLTLWLGFLLLLCGPVVPFAARPVGVAFDRLLRGLLFVVERSARLRLGHVYVPDIPLWWLWPFYLLLAVAGLGRWHRSLTRWALLGCGLWLVAGLSWALRPSGSGQFRCTVLSVGHGSAVLLESPSGRTLLYDAGMMGNGHVAAEIVKRALWSQGHWRLDAVLVSHADTDHLNALPELLDDVPVGQLLVSRAFARLRRPAARLVCRQAAGRGVRVRVVAAGDRLSWDGVQLTVLHPVLGFSSDADNENSVVVLVQFGGRRILLTGDLDGAGLERLLQVPSVAVDVLVAPHHGGRSANPPELGLWARPRFVVVSGDARRSGDALTESYPTAAVLTTRRHGAVTVTVWADGRCRVGAFRWRRR